MKSTLVTDTSVLFAVLDPDDRDHARCISLAAEASLIVPTSVVTETCLIAHSRLTPHAVDVLLESVIDETLVVVELDTYDYGRMRHVLTKYADLGLDFVDASVVAIAERLEQDTIATLDRRHFSVVKPLHVESFTLVP